MLRNNVIIWGRYLPLLSTILTRLNYLLEVDLTALSLTINVLMPSFLRIRKSERKLEFVKDFCSDIY